MVLIQAKPLHRLVEEVVVAVGTPTELARDVADHLVGSHLAGHDSHGIQHLPRYVEEVRQGHIVPDASPSVESEAQSVVRVRGHWAWGPVTGNFATRLAIKKARQDKVVLVSAVEINHIGRLGDYVEQAAAENVVMLLFSGGHAEEFATAAPHGGSRAVLSPNPIGIGFPTNGHPIVVDFASTQVAGGKIAVARAKGEAAPAGAIIDRHGLDSTDPEAYYDGGALLPFGQHKGFGIMVALEVLARILSGADDYSNTRHGGKHQRNAGMSLLAIDSGIFAAKSDFKHRASELAERIRAVPPTPGRTRVMVPGDYEARARAVRQKEGIEIPETTWREIEATAHSLDVSADVFV